MQARATTTVQSPAPPARAAVVSWLQEATGDAARVTIHLSLPVPRGFNELAQIARRYEQACDAARERLAALAVPAAEADALRAALLAIDVAPESIHPGARAVAAFAAAGRARAFSLATPAADRVAVGRTYDLRPLCAHLHADVRFRVLALAEGRVELYEGDRFALRVVDAPDVPRNLAEVVGTEIGRNASTLQHHSSGAGGEAVVFHGHGGAARGRNVDRERFHVAVARAVKRRWAARHDPLVLVADVGHQGGFRRAADLPGLIAEGVPSTPDHDPDALRERVVAVIERHARERERERLVELGDKLAHGRAVEGPRDVLAVALESRVERVWIDREQRLPGRADAETGRIVDAAGDDDALDALAELCLARGGEVVVADPGSLPGGAAVVAELRGGRRPRIAGDPATDGDPAAGDGRAGDGRS